MSEDIEMKKKDLREELDKLKLHLLKVINGEGSIVSITGDAGMGKSRLLAELKKSTDMEKVTLLEGRALSFGENLSYHPFTDILKNWAGIKEGENEIEVEIADGVKVRVIKSTIAQVLNKTEPAK